MQKRFSICIILFHAALRPNLRPAGTSFQRKEGSIHSKRPTFSPLPLEGAARRSETGLAPPYVGNAFPPYRYPHHFRTSPFIKINAKRHSGAFINRLLEMLLPTLFHTASALSAPTGHLPLEGKAAIREYHLLKKGGEAATRALNPEPNESKVKRSCEEMNPHFFTAPFSYGNTYFSMAFHSSG